MAEQVNVDNSGQDPARDSVAAPDVAASPRWLKSRWSTAVPAIAIAVGLGALGLQWVGYGTAKDSAATDVTSETSTAVDPSTSTSSTATTLAPVVLGNVATPDTTAPSTTTALPTTVVTAVAPVTSTSAAPTVVAAATTTVATTVAATTTSAVPSNPAPTAPPTTAPPALTAGQTAAPTRWAVFSGGTVYLRGVVPDDAVAANIAGKAAQIVGADHVVDEYTRIPGAPVPKSAPLYVSDVILFGPDNAQIHPQFEQLLNLGVGLLTTFPTVTVTVRGHTDDQGGPEYNLRLASRRVEAVIAYVTARGVARDRLVGQPIGASQPVADNNTDLGRQLNRRIEFVIDGLLDA
jgi:outer membrane protein OmpA-like peptidoglycan-associated protein